jgi:D-glycero-alpha-D-manno-heptose 1-phosphate guanylyltransferase
MKENYIEAIILAGGKGTRLKTVLDDRPKPMAIIGGKPFIEWLLLLLQQQGVQKVVICTGYMGEKIESYFGDGHEIGIKINYACDPFPLGTGGAVRNALAITTSNHLLILNGDSYFRLDLPYFLNTHHTQNAKATISLGSVENSSRYGSVKINEDGEITTFLEKLAWKQPGLINTGIYIIEREVINQIPEKQTVSLEKEVFPSLIGRGLYGMQSNGFFIDIGTPESFYKAEKILRDEFIYLLK